MCYHSEADLLIMPRLAASETVIIVLPYSPLYPSPRPLTRWLAGGAFRGGLQKALPTSPVEQVVIEPRQGFAT